MFLIVSLYLDGEIRSIEGYVNDEETAKRRVEKFNYTVTIGESYKYSYQIVENLNY